MWSREEAAVPGVTLNDGESDWKPASVTMDHVEVSHSWMDYWTHTGRLGFEGSPHGRRVTEEGEEGETFEAHQARIFVQP